MRDARLQTSALLVLRRSDDSPPHAMGGAFLVRVCHRRIFREGEEREGQGQIRKWRTGSGAHITPSPPTPTPTPICTHIYPDLHAGSASARGGTCAEREGRQGQEGCPPTGAASAAKWECRKIKGWQKGCAAAAAAATAAEREIEGWQEGSTGKTHDFEPKTFCQNQAVSMLRRARRLTEPAVARVSASASAATAGWQGQDGSTAAPWYAPSFPEMPPPPQSLALT
eukprot:SAG22_NODE_204_length_15309_cov_12.747206_2_plen_226_part_00